MVQCRCCIARRELTSKPRDQLGEHFESDPSWFRRPLCRPLRGRGWVLGHGILHERALLAGRSFREPLHKMGGSFQLHSVATEEPEQHLVLAAAVHHDAAACA